MGGSPCSVQGVRFGGLKSDLVRWSGPIPHPTCSLQSAATATACSEQGEARTTHYSSLSLREERAPLLVLVLVASG
jgi:hypothetical protein